VAFVDIGDTRYAFRDGLTALEIRQSYGFVADAVQVTIPQSILPENVLDTTLGKNTDREHIVAVMDDVGPQVQFEGTFDSFGGALTPNKELNSGLTLAGRSLMTLLTDTDPITKAWFDTDWSSVVEELVVDAGLVPAMIVASGVMAGEQLPDGRFMLSVDNQRPAEIVNNAVSATGFVATVVNGSEFVFAFEYVPSWYECLSLIFAFNEDRSDIDQIDFANGSIERIVVSKLPNNIPPGAPVQVVVEDSKQLSGVYFVTEATYNSLNDSTTAAYSVVRELPELRSK